MSKLSQFKVNRLAGKTNMSKAYYSLRYVVQASAVENSSVAGGDSNIAHFLKFAANPLAVGRNKGLNGDELLAVQSTYALNVVDDAQETRPSKASSAVAGQDDEAVDVSVGHS